MEKILVGDEHRFGIFCQNFVLELSTQLRIAQPFLELQPILDICLRIEELVHTKSLEDNSMVTNEFVWQQGTAIMYYQEMTSKILKNIQFRGPSGPWKRLFSEHLNNPSMWLAELLKDVDMGRKPAIVNNSSNIINNKRPSAIVQTTKTPKKLSNPNSLASNPVVASNSSLPIHSAVISSNSNTSLIDHTAVSVERDSEADPANAAMMFIGDFMDNSNPAIESNISVQWNDQSQLAESSTITSGYLLHVDNGTTVTDETISWRQMQEIEQRNQNLKKQQEDELKEQKRHLNELALQQRQNNQQSNNNLEDLELNASSQLEEMERLRHQERLQREEQKKILESALEVEEEMIFD